VTIVFGRKSGETKELAGVFIFSHLQKYKILILEEKIDFYNDGY